MHEFSLIDSILNIITDTARERKMRRITRVVLTIGRMRQIVKETMVFAFEAASAGTIAEGAELVITFVETRMLCNNCGKEFTPEDNVYVCMQCGSSDLKTLQGMELLVQTIEGEE